MADVRIHELPLPTGQVLLTDELVVYQQTPNATVRWSIGNLIALIQTGLGQALATPSLTLTVVSDTEIDVSWLAVTGATSYRLKRSPTQDINDAADVFNSPGLSFNDTGLLANTTYYYWLLASGSGYTDSGYATGNATTTGTVSSDTTPPVLSSAVIPSTNAQQIILTYNEALQNVSIATNLYSISGSHPVSSVSVSGSTVILTTSTPFVAREVVGLTYIGSAVKDTAGNPAPTFTNIPVTNNLVVVAVQLQPPTPFTATALGTTSIGLQWGDYGGASSVLIQRSLDGVTWTDLVSRGSGNTYADNGLTPNTRYYYQIQGVGDGVNTLTSGWASANAVTNQAASFDTVLTFVSSTTANAAGVNASVLATNSNIKLRFTAIPNATLGVNTMNILVGSGTTYVQKMRVDFPGPYTGQPFEFTDTDGTVHSDYFINGNVRF